MPIKAITHQQPTKGRVSQFPGTAAVPQEGWWRQPAVWKPGCKEALLIPKMPISSAAKHFHNSLFLKKAVAHSQQVRVT